jgi:hypothetical protein
MSASTIPPEPTPSTTAAPIPSGGPINITGPLSIPELLDRTFRALRARFGVLMLSAAIVMVPLGILTLLLTGRFMTGYFEFLELTMADPDMVDAAFDDFLGEMLGYLGALFLLSLLYIISSSLVSLMSMHHIQRFLHGETSTVGEGWRVAMRRVLPLIGMQILQILAIGVVSMVIAVVVGVLIFGVAFVFGGIVSVIEDQSASVFLAMGLVILFLVGYLLLIILMLAPTIYFMGRWLVAAPCLVLEGLGPVQALKRSWTLTKGRIWRGIIYVVLLTIFSYVVIGLPLGIAQWIAMIAMPSQLALIGIISTVVGYILNLFYQPFYATGTVLFYYDLRVRAEAYDVALRVAALEAELAPDASPT